MKSSMLSVPASVVQVAATHNVSTDSVAALWSAYQPHFNRFNEVRESAAGVAANAPKAARTLRLELKAIRVAADKTRLELNEDGLRLTKANNGIKAILDLQLVPMEQAMEAIEKAEEIAEAKRKAALKADREEQLRPYCLDTSMYRLDECSEEAFQELLRVSKTVHEAEKAKVAKVEADRIAAEKAAREAQAKRDQEAAAERERMRLDNERLAKIAAQERAAREESERVARLAAAEREAKAAQERAVMEGKAKEERAKREAAEAALKAQQEAEAKRQAAEKAAARKAAAAPDKQKLTALAAAVRTIAVPSLTTDAGGVLQSQIAQQVAKFAAWLESEAAKL